MTPNLPCQWMGRAWILRLKNDKPILKQSSSQAEFLRFSCFVAYEL
nr:MAG TPA: hypothetical protein [Caudoviricetes sp.]